jgi:hypothetical protein
MGKNKKREGIGLTFILRDPGIPKDQAELSTHVTLVIESIFAIRGRNGNVYRESLMLRLEGSKK